MSQRRRSRTLPRSSPPSSPIVSAAVQQEPPKLTIVRNEVLPVEIRFAESDEDICAIHRFLIPISEPARRCPLNFVKSLAEIERVVRGEAGLMAIHDGELVGSLGLMKVTWWYGDGEFMVDRWHFLLPAFRHSARSDPLLEEARAIAHIAGLEFIHQGKVRDAKSGVPRMMPRAYPPESE